MAGGRPTIYSNKKADAICLLIAEGQSLLAICKADEMPHTATVYRWLASNDEFRDKYARARCHQTERMAAEILEIADDTSNDTIETELADGVVATRTNSENIQRSRLRVDTRKWLMSKLKPKKYGDKVQHTGEDGGDIKHSLTVTFK